jgi:hypothetical protein
MSWKIDHQCPQCGGPITLEETDRFFLCGFCRVSLYITSDGPFQYYLPPKKQTDWLIYVPYWRFKGTVFAIRGAEINHRILDTSRIAAAFPRLPFTLGVRPQTQNLKFAAGKLAGEFIRQTVALSELLAGMEHQLKELGVDVVSDDTLEKAYIGETVSIIYAPFQKTGSMWLDAINEKYKYLMDDSLEDIASDPQTARTWSPKFLPAMCPDCGWDLSGEPESCAFICKNCATAWSSSVGGLKKVPLGASLAHDDNVAYIPFWRIRPRITGADIHSYADLVRFANLPRVVQSKWETIPLFFWIPAFKIVPNVFLRLGGMLSISPVEDIVYDKLPLKSVYPVTLSQGEAEESMKIIFASLVVSKRKNYARLPDIHFSAEESELVLLPFVPKGNELIYEKQKIAIQKVAMTYGRNF